MHLRLLIYLLTVMACALGFAVVTWSMTNTAMNQDDAEHKILAPTDQGTEVVQNDGLSKTVTSQPPQFEHVENVALRVSAETRVCMKGRQVFPRSWILEQLPEFIATYDRRPFASNRGGTRIMHQFALWCMIKHLRPNYVIESGIHTGLGTWILRQAAPNAKLVMLDPGSHLKYTDNHTDSEYFIKKDFIDFGKMDWKNHVIPSETLVFIDDHQNPVRRIQEALKHGFVHMIFDDNYGIHGGDVTGLKAYCHLTLNPGKVSQYLADEKKSGQYTRRQLSWSWVRSANITFHQHIETYYEFPMIFNSFKGQLGLDNRNMLLNETSGSRVLGRYGLTKFPPEVEMNGFSNIVYVKIQP